MAEVDVSLEEDGAEGEIGTPAGRPWSDDQTVAEYGRLDVAERNPQDNLVGIDMNRPKDMELRAHPVK